MGLNPQVLNRILKPEDDRHSLQYTSSNSNAGKADGSSDNTPSDADDDDDGDEEEELEIQFEEAERARQEGLNSIGEEITRVEVGESSNFHVRLRRGSSFGVEAEQAGQSSDRPILTPDVARLHRMQTVAPSDVHAEYAFSGTGDRPTPQIRLLLSNSPRSGSPMQSSDSEGRGRSRPSSQNKQRKINHVSSGHSRSMSSPASDAEVDAITPDSDDEADEATPRLSAKEDGATLIPTSPTLEHVKMVPSPIFAISPSAQLPGMESILHDMDELELEGSAIEELEVASIVELDPIPTILTPDQDPTAHREIIVSLPSDVAFFELLTHALNSLSALHTSQQAMFNTAVQRLCSLISQSITPTSSKMSVFKNIPVPQVGKGKQKADMLHDIPSPSSYSKSDLYAWRQIFTLWIEAQIFESNAEWDRGERPVEQAEKRLKAFATEVVKRGLGDRRTLKRKESREAWDDFLRLNVLLLDLKRFQLANINAARKILKKHDKRTALTASVGFPEFVRTSLDVRTDSNGNIKTWGFYNTSLPHVLLASLTETLLPILPSLDDYMCLICMSIAFKPIRLQCRHMFCVRCLAKMQKSGKAFCPLCRAPNVLQADKTHLDVDMME